MVLFPQTIVAQSFLQKREEEQNQRVKEGGTLREKERERGQKKRVKDNEIEEKDTKKREQKERRQKETVQRETERKE